MQQPDITDLASAFEPTLAKGDPWLTNDQGDVFSGQDIRERAARFALVLERHGLEAGDRLAVMVEKSVDAVALYVAALKLGAIYLPLNPAYTDDEAIFILRDATPHTLITSGSRAETLTGLATRTMLLGANNDQEKVPDQAAQGTDLVAEADAVRADEARGFWEALPSSIDPDATAAILYTSGTTGRPKGAMLSHRNLLSNAHALARVWQFTKRDTLLHALPIFHAHGLYVGLNLCLLTGAPLIFLPRFDAEEVARHLPAVTVYMGVPTHYGRLLSVPGLSPKTLSNMRLMISGSAPLSPQAHSACAQTFGHQILERYGMTETVMIASNPREGERRPGKVGFPLPGVEVRIAGSARIGEIEVRGPNVFSGYWNRPERQAEDFTEDGFFRTGDLGQFDADGYLEIVGRAKELIISGGQNIYPREVEDALRELTGIADAAVFAVPDADFGEAVAAAVILDETGAPHPIEDLRDALGQKLSRYKLPKYVEYLDTLPRNAMGKVQKHALQASFQDQQSAS
ncbi:MAG: AMP-binding protein [Pseudomonadota bacterium]